MHKFLALAFLLIITAGCSAQDLTKQQYYEKGLEFLDKGNPRGAIIAFKKAVAKDQNFFEARFKLASAYLLTRKFESAHRELQKVLRLNPSFHEVHLSLARVYISLEKIEEAKSEINYYLQEIQSNAEAFEIMAMAYASGKDYSKSEEFLNKSLEISPQRISSKLILADILMESGKLRDAEVQVNSILELDRSNKKALHRLAVIQAKQNNMDGAAITYEKILETDPKDLFAHFKLGLIYLRKNDIARARTIAEELIHLDEKGSQGPYLMGIIHFHEKNIDKAIISLQISVKKSNIPGAYYYLGLSHLLKGNLEQARSEFQRVVDMQPNAVTSRLLLAMIHLKGGRAEAAERETMKVIDLDDKNAVAHNLLGSIYLALNKSEQAMEEFDLAIKLNPKLVDAHIKKGAFNILLGDSESAEQEFINAVEIAPELLNSRIILAKYYIKKKDLKKAIETLEAGLADTNNDAILYFMMGRAYAELKKQDKAVKYFEKAKVSNPEFFLPYFSVALMHMQNGERERAKAEYKSVLEKNERNVSALLMMGKIMESEEKDSEALSYYMKATGQKRVSAFIALSQYYLRKKNNEQAIEVLDEALILEPKNLDVINMQGEIYMADNNYQAALSVYRKMEVHYPDSGAVKLAGVYEVQGNFDTAIKKLESFLIKKPDRVDVLEKLVALNIKKANYAVAEKRAQEIIKLRPENSAGHILLASVYILNQKMGKAESTLKTAISMNPSDLNARISLGRLYVARKNYERALKMFKDIENEKPDYAPIHFMQGSIYDELNEKNLAITKYKKTLQLSPEYIPALNNLAYLYASGYGPIDEAVELAEKGKKLMPKSGSVTDTLGWVLYQKGDYNDSLKNFIEATHYIPGEPTIRYHLALAYLKKGMIAPAEEQLKNAVRLGRVKPFAEFDETQKLLRDLK